MNAKWQSIPFFHTVLAIWYNLYVTRSYKWALLQFISRTSGHGSCHFEDYLLVHQIVIFRIDLELQYIFDKFLSLSLRWLQKSLGPGLMVVGMESYKCLAPPMEPLDQVDKIVQMWPKVKITNQFVQIPPLGLICQCQVDGHTLSSVSLASVGCPDPALLSNIFQVQTGANVDGKDLHPLTCTLGSALSFVTGHPVGAPPRCHWYHHFIFGELPLTNHCHSWDSQKIYQGVQQRSVQYRLPALRPWTVHSLRHCARPLIPLSGSL